MTSPDDKELQRIGRQVAKGAVAYLTSVAFLFICLLFAAWFIGNASGLWAADDCDASVWKRCGVTVVTDHKTGLQYLVTSTGGIIQRGQKP